MVLVEASPHLEDRPIVRTEAHAVDRMEPGLGVRAVAADELANRFRQSIHGNGFEFGRTVSHCASSSAEQRSRALCIVRWWSSSRKSMRSWSFLLAGGREGKGQGGNEPIREIQAVVARPQAAVMRRSESVRAANPAKTLRSSRTRRRSRSPTRSFGWRSARTPRAPERSRRRRADARRSPPKALAVCCATLYPPRPASD